MWLAVQINRNVLDPIFALPPTITSSAWLDVDDAVQSGAAVKQSDDEWILWSLDSSWVVLVGSTEDIVLWIPREKVCSISAKWEA
jgi:hypothetical protein